MGIDNEGKISKEAREFKVPVDTNDQKAQTSNTEITSGSAPEEEEKIQMSDEIKIKREEMKKERERLRLEKEEQERKRLLLVEFVKKNEEEFKQIWFNLREKANKLDNINTITRKEKEKINKMLLEGKPEDLVFELKTDFLRNENLMNEGKKEISQILDENNKLSKENMEIVKDVLGELNKKYDDYKTELARIDKNTAAITGSMNSVFREVKDKNIFEAIPDPNKEAMAVSGKEFENLDETMKKIEKDIEMEIEKLKLFPTEVK